MSKNKETLTIIDLERQEELTDKRFKILGIPTTAANVALEKAGPRPKDSYLELMNWSERLAKSYLNKPNINFNRFVHNKIIIDGPFLQFCEENKIEITPIIKDSFISWNSEGAGEQFFMQGMFLIKKNDMFFIHCALYAKGNQFEDEISFIILVDNDNFNPYLALRNEYEEWASKRDRNNLRIRVIDGEDIPYDQDAKWDDIFLPTELKNNIKLSIEGFLKSKHIYEEKKIPWKRGIIFHGIQGCGKTSLIKTIISNYDFKPITVSANANDDVLIDAFSYAEDQNPALLFFEDLDSLLQNINLSLFLNLMDGISTKNGLLIIATANSLEGFKDNIKDRPSRFDRKFEIPLPDESMTLKYLKKWFGNSLTDKESKKIAVYAYDHKFSYAYIKELYISSIYNSIADDRDTPNINDINKALTQIMNDKFKKNSKSIGIDKYIEAKHK